jgi:hypothetical protein
MFIPNSQHVVSALQTLRMFGLSVYVVYIHMDVSLFVQKVRQIKLLIIIFIYLHYIYAT